MPQIVRFYQMGGPENLEFEAASSEQAGEGEAKLRVLAVGLNRAELLYLRGEYLEETKLPSRIGYEAAGVVESVGLGVDQSWVGKYVSIVPPFSMAQYGVLGEEAVIPAASLAEYPARLSPTQAAATWMQYLTAYGALVGFGELKAGETIIISAASSSVGIAAIQIAKAQGATAIATTRTSKKVDQIRELGADHVIVTEEEDLVARVMEITQGKGARLIFDPIGGPFVEKLAEAAAPGGILFQYGGLSKQPTPLPLKNAIAKAVTVRSYSMHELRDDPNLLAAAKQYIFEHLVTGVFEPCIAKTFPFSEAADAYRYLESNEQVGKIVITI